MNPIIIAVYRLRKKAADDVFDYILKCLSIPEIHVTYMNDKRQIDIDDRISILFRCGELYKMAGIRCNFYDAYGPGAVKMLARGDSMKIDIFKFVDALVKIYKLSENSPSQNPSVRP